MKRWLYVFFCAVILLTTSLTGMADTSLWQKTKAVFQPKEQPYPGRIKIVFWHSFSGSLGKTLAEIIKQFNNTQSQYYVVGVNKSTYNNTLNAAATAYRSGTQPNILLSYDIGTAMMVHSGGAILPLYKLLEITGVSINTKDFWPVVKGYYSENGKLAGFPFNSSSPVLYYNKDIFKKAGITKPPRTWQQMTEIAKKLYHGDQQCVFTSGYPSWVLIEEFSMWNNLPYATDNNGFNSLQPKITLNTPKMIAFLTQLQQWSKQGIFMYGGRGSAANSLFTSQKCAMILQSSSSIGNFKDFVAFNIGVAKMPIWNSNGESFAQNTIIGGAAIWTLRLPKDTKNAKSIYKGIALFYKFLSQPKTQAEWAEASGYIPATKSAFELMEKHGFYKNNPYAKIPLESLNNAPPKPYTKGIRLGNFPLIRKNSNAMLESIVSGANVKKELMNVEVLDNKLIQQFYQQNK